MNCGRLVLGNVQHVTWSSVIPLGKETIGSIAVRRVALPTSDRCGSRAHIRHARRLDASGRRSGSQQACAIPAIAVLGEPERPRHLFDRFDIAVLMGIYPW